MASIRERSPGDWEVRGYTGNERNGNPTQVSRTVHGTKRDAQLAEWLEIKTPGWAPLTQRDQAGRVRLICRDPIARMSVASLGV